MEGKKNIGIIGQPLTDNEFDFAPSIFDFSSWGEEPLQEKIDSLLEWYKKQDLINKKEETAIIEEK